MRSLCLAAILVLLASAALAVSQNDVGKAQENISNIDWNIRTTQETIQQYSDDLQECEQVEGACDDALKKYYSDERAKAEKELEALEKDRAEAEKNLQDLTEALAKEKAAAAAAKEQNATDGGQ